MDDQPTDLDTLVFNGVDGVTGGYLLPPMTPAQVSALAQGQTIETVILDELKNKAFSLTNPHAGVEADARNLAETGWGLILAHDADPAILDALQPLLQLRQAQAGDRFKIFSGAKGYRPEESKSQFLERHGMGPGPATPDKVPYYLLIAGHPHQIPYRFQYQMDVQYAVGRVAFDTIEEYARYAHSVVQAETQAGLPPVAGFLGVANADDRATQLSAGNLVAPLALAVSEKVNGNGQDRPGAVRPSWQVHTLLAEQATKANLSAWLESPLPPAVLFSASHGIAFPNGHARQLPHQGALICQDWPGPQKWRGEISEDFYFSADDLSSDANLLGSVAFFFACYGAGTPQMDEFAHQIWGDDVEHKIIAPRDFVARLPQRMLALPKGGALAVVGHVDRAWGVSFFWGKAGSQLQVYEDCFKRLIADQYPIGYAVEVFNERYAEISSDLSSKIEDIKHFFKVPNDQEIARLWTANNDARNYIILGDPAVRLNVGSQPDEALVRPSLEPIEIIAAKKTSGDPRPKPVAGELPNEMPSSIEETAVNYGVSGNSDQTGLDSTLQDLALKLGTLLNRLLDESASLEVTTYTSTNLGSVRYGNGVFSGAELRAVTRLDLNGNIQVCWPESGAGLDRELWQAHLEMVRQAHANRAELLKAIIAAGSGLTDTLKPEKR